MENAELFDKLFSDDKSINGDNFAVDELLNFTDNEDGEDSNDVALGNAAVVGTTELEGCGGGASNDVSAIDSANSSVSGDVSCQSFAEPQFSSELCVPYDDLAELEWLSNFVEDSFSSEDLNNLSLISGTKPPPEEGSETRNFKPELSPNDNPTFQPDLLVPGKARSKRPRAAPCDWASRLSVLTPATARPYSASANHHSPSASAKKKQKKKGIAAAAGSGSGDGGGSGGDGRRCLHCATDKTPQWRTGPMGPKTLCNACGVRYKSGRLVPEYRPAASPTFMVAKHSNSHRKVMELRRQKEVQRAHHMFDQGLVFDVGSSDAIGDNYLIHQHVGPDFRHLI